VELIVWNEQTKHLISGHQRYGILLQKGVTEAPMIVVNMSSEDELAASLTMNNPTIEGEFDEPVLELIGQVENSSQELFESVRMDDLKTSLEQSFDSNSGNAPGEDLVKNLQADWDTECPCCGNKWKMKAGDLSVAEG